MPFISNIGAPASLPYLIVEYAWAITGLYFVATWLFTKSIKRRERIFQRGPDLILFFAGFILPLLAKPPSRSEQPPVPRAAT